MNSYVVTYHDGTEMIVFAGSPTDAAEKARRFDLRIKSVRPQ